MKIGELAKKTACPIETIRFYEQQGLLAMIARTGSNYRVYSDLHVARLRFIMRCRSLDMALDEIRELLKLNDAPTENCAEVNDILDAHIGHVSERIRELRQLERQLRHLRAQCLSARGTDECGILTQLWNTNPPATTSQAGAPVHVHGAHKALVHGSKARGSLS